MSNVETWKKALDSGHEPRDYPYAGEEVPLGQFEVTLDLKVWAKNTMGISCYFTALASGKKFRLTVFRRKSDEVYALTGSELDFKESPVNCNYLITVTANKKNEAVLQAAELKG